MLSGENLRRSNAPRCCCKSALLSGWRRQNIKKNFWRAFSIFVGDFRQRCQRACEEPAPTKTDPPNATSNGYAQLFFSLLSFSLLSRIFQYIMLRTLFVFWHLKALGKHKNFFLPCYRVSLYLVRLTLPKEA